jgi:WD40 repeat protein
VAFAAGGKQFVSGGFDHTARVWDARTGRELHCLRGHGSNVHAVTYSPDGKWIAAASARAHLWDATTGKEVRRLGPAEGQLSVAFAPDGKTLATGNDRRVRLFDVQTGALLAELVLDNEGGRPVVFSPDGKLLAVGPSPAAAGDVALWDVATRKVVRRLCGHPCAVMSLAFARGGKALLSAGFDSTLRLWQVDTGKEVRRFPSLASFNQFVAVSADGKRFAFPGEDGIEVREVDTGKKLLQLGGLEGNYSAAFSPDGTTLIAGSFDGGVRAWELATGKQTCPFGGHRLGIHALTVAPDGKRVASGSYDGGTILWDAATGKQLRLLGGLHEAEALAVAFAPDGKVLATAGPESENIRLWDVGSGKELPALGQHPPSPGPLAFAPDGKVLASGAVGGTVRLWDVKGRKLLRELKAHEVEKEGVTAVAFAPNGRLLATAAGAGKAIRLWDVSTGKLRAHFGNHAGAVESLCFSPDGRLLASVPLNSRIADAQIAEQEHRIRLWDVASGHEVRRLSAIGTTAFGARFSPDGRMIAAGQEGGGVCLWEVTTGKARARLVGHLDTVRSVAFFPGGKRLASGSTDSTGLIWDVERVLRGKAKRKPVEALWADLARDGPDGGQGTIGGLLATPGPTVALLVARLRPAPAIDERRVARLMDDLDNPAFQRRESAARELEALGERAEPGLRQALAGRPGLEARRRLERLLGRIQRERLAPSGEALRAVRGVEVLERLGTPEARRALEALARGAPGARLTEEARAALGRLR